jgi:hypothetical protein
MHLRPVKGGASKFPRAESAHQIKVHSSDQQGILEGRVRSSDQQGIRAGSGHLPLPPVASNEHHTRTRADSRDTQDTQDSQDDQNPPCAETNHAPKTPAPP